MLKTNHFYIDFMEGCHVDHYVKDTLLTHFGDIQFHFSTITEGQRPECKYDLFIARYEQFRKIEHIIALKDDYEEILLIDVPVDEFIFKFFSEHIRITILKKPLLNNELSSFLFNYMNRVLYHSEHKILDNLLKNAQNSIVIADLDGNIIYANAYFQALCGYNNAELISNSPRIIKSDYHDDAFYKELWLTITSGNVWEGIFINKSKDNILFYEEATISPIKDGHGNIEKYLKIGKNITREKLLLDHLSQEVKLARTVLDSLLPSPLGDDFLQFDYHMIHYNEIGGDFIYFNKTSPTTYHFALIDVMGHGVSSALVAITLTQMFKDYINFKSLGDSVKAINKLLCDLNTAENDRSLFVTGLFLEFDLRNDELKVINAGHPDLIIKMKSGEISHLASNNMLLGVLDENIFESYKLTLSPIHRVLCFTDGLFETHNISYDMALDILDESITHLGNQKFYEGIMHSFSKNQHINDDITICKIEFL
ncbi:SpoIIE family protein phosphatase [Fusibacter ferrireducens]|uniref:SpoIIE family protein phosphatase n=1 Tax=Fusibacter ferrireducens TaxID=2785058 RepID=A0ABR9ZW02_9FIRM|nr:PP2C family protein-serine/threonine phosphatase [Fusibacter ferrireducens]MBF4694338.1 SpoIIE family protein phosphatase [Fusibacter ferrireducens]